MSLYDSAIAFIERVVAPIASRVGTQRHVVSIKDGFITAMPFMIVGSFLLIVAFPPFAKDTTFAFGRAWLDFASNNMDAIMLPFKLTMGIMTLYIVAGISYALARQYNLHGLNNSLLAIAGFLLIAIPFKDGLMDVTFLGGQGIFTAMIIAIYTVELTRILTERNLTIRLPEAVPENIAKSFESLIPILIMIFTVYPFSLFIQHTSGVMFPALVMDFFKPLVSASDTWGGIMVAVLIVHLLWFCGIHGASIVGGLLMPMYLANLEINQTALEAGEPLTRVFIEPFMAFYITLGGSGATFSLVLLYMTSKDAQLKSLGKLSIIPACFNINEPIIFGTPIVFNPMFFLPWILIPMVNATVAYIALSTDMVAKIVSLTPWTAPSPIGAMWATGWHISPLILVIALVAIDLVLWFPFFKIYEGQLIKAEHEKAAAKAAKAA